MCDQLPVFIHLIDGKPACYIGGDIVPVDDYGGTPGAAVCFEQIRREQTIVQILRSVQKRPNIENLSHMEFSRPDWENSIKSKSGLRS